MTALHSPPQTPWDHGQRREALVASVLMEIFQGRLRAGQHLVARDLADRYGVSQTPIREALISLAGIGVVDLLPNRGAVVRRVTGQDVQEVCQVRKLLECEATRAACGRIPPAELAPLHEATLRLSIPATGPEYIREARRLDNAFHDLIATWCGNTLLAREIGRLKLVFRTYRDVSWERVEAENDYRRIPAEAVEHLAIMDALLAGDGRQATQAMARHIQNGERYWSRILPGLSPPETETRPSSC